MEVIEAIEKRRAIYTAQFSGARVKPEVIQKMLELANWAPTHKHTEPWRFVVFEEKALIDLIDFIKKDYIHKTPADEFNPGVPEKWEKRKGQLSTLIAIVMKRHEHKGIPEFEELASVAMAVQNMWLYTASLGDVGAYWSTPAFALETSFHDRIGLDQNERCLGLFLVGTIADDATDPEAIRGDWKEKVRWYKN